MDKLDRVKIYEKTMDYIKKGGFETPGGSHIVFNGIKDMLEGTKFYSSKINNKYDNLPKYETEIKVVNNDCLYAAKELVDNGLKPAVLNMASFHTPGGGVERGSAAQEESIFRRTNIALSLYQFHPVGENYRIKQLEERYPLNFNYGGIYTPKVTVFRDSETNDCELLDSPFFIDVITLPAVRKPSLVGGKLPEWVREALKKKVRQIFDIAIENKNDSLVLGAFGCGAYGTPPSEMAEIFKEILELKEFKTAFKVVYFAIIDDKNAYREHNPEGNLKPFKKTFNK